jgi:diguanylate cyclase (GGDEF)-like protein
MASLSVAELRERAHRLEWLPHGRALPAEQWERRHRALRRLLWGHVAAVPVLSILLRGLHPVQDVAMAGAIAAFALLSGQGEDRRHQSAMTALGLMTASALIVHASGGAIEAHFHFFLMMSVLALYEDWLPYGLGVAYVLLHHAVLAALAPRELFSHGGDVLAWAAIHVGFIAAVGVMNIVSWRINELSRERTASALVSVQTQYEISDVLSAAVSLDDAVPRLLEVIGRRLDWSMGLFWTADPRLDHLRPSSVWLSDPARLMLMDDYVARAAYARGAGLAGEAWQLGAPAWSERLGSPGDDPTHDAVREVEQRSGLALPIRVEDEVVGVLAFMSAEERGFGDGLVELLESVSRQLAIFMERVRRTEQVGLLETVAMTDALTELPNRRAWNDRLPRELAWSSRDQRPLCLAMIDLDHFKAYNDAHGHAAGDRLLVQAGRAWSDVIRQEDVLARYGGEEFALLLPGCELEEALNIAERIRDAVPAGQTCSVGLAMWDGAEGRDSLTERADGALYAAKHAGRDRTAVAQGALAAA